jgi:2-desacetyl-2-hydroxyethyl bacteriochlorophyllide A dehydrogenase
MKAIHLVKPGRLVAGEIAEPTAPGPGETLVRVHRVGVCGTDLHAFRGRQPFFTFPRILGHELGVEVLAVGPDVEAVRVGDHCAVEPYLNCGRCIACRRGRTNCCTGLQVLGVHRDGGMRERFVLPAAKLHASTALTFDQLALVETLAIGAHAVARAGVEAGEFVLVIGAGPIGLATAQFAVAQGATVIVLDVNAARLAFCREQLGVAHTIHGSTEDPLDTLTRLTAGDLPTAVFDATGNPQSMAGAFQFPAHGGRLVFVGLFPGEVTFDDPNFHRRELSLLASRNALAEDFPRLIGLIAAGRLDTTPWISHRAAFADVPDTFARWTEPSTGVIKAMIEMPED